MMAHMDLEDEHDDGGVAVWRGARTTWYSGGGGATYTRGEAKNSGLELKKCCYEKIT